MPHRLELLLDDDDWRAVQAEIARSQALDHRFFGTSVRNLSDVIGGSNIAGYYLADACRQLREYRDLWEREHQT